MAKTKDKMFKTGDKVRGNAAAISKFPELDLRGEVRAVLADGQQYRVTIGSHGHTHVVHSKWLEENKQW